MAIGSSLTIYVSPSCFYYLTFGGGKSESTARTRSNDRKQEEWSWWEEKIYLSVKSALVDNGQSARRFKTVVLAVLLILFVHVLFQSAEGIGISQYRSHVLAHKIRLIANGQGTHVVIFKVPNHKSTKAYSVSLEPFESRIRKKSRISLPFLFYYSSPPSRKMYRYSGTIARRIISAFS